MDERYFKNSAFSHVDKYLLSVMPDRDAVLMEMEALALDRGFPFIGPLVGEFLGILARAIKAKTCFELGSGYGFSTLHLARAMPPDGKVICTDDMEENARLAKQFFKQAGQSSKLEFRIGDALAILKEYKGPFDIILMDISKEDYPRGFEEAWPKLAVGGLFIADNLLRYGRVWEDNNEPATVGIRRFTEMLYNQPDAQTSILPLRDGVSVTMKLR
ncbi:O-methyltransferase [bacterium]|nr:O-methyltransferase [bacterium]